MCSVIFLEFLFGVLFPMVQAWSYNSGYSISTKIYLFTVAGMLAN